VVVWRVAKFTGARDLNELESNKKLARELVDAMTRADTQWFLDNYADDVLVWTMGSTMISGRQDHTAEGVPRH